MELFKTTISFSKDRAGNAGFISWKRLTQELFKEGSEIKLGERITHIEIDERGIQYYVEKVGE